VNSVFRVNLVWFLWKNCFAFCWVVRVSRFEVFVCLPPWQRGWEGAIPSTCSASLSSAGPSHQDFILRPLVSARTSFFNFVLPALSSCSRCAGSRSHFAHDFSRSRFLPWATVSLASIQPPPNLVFPLRCRPSPRHRCFFPLGAFHCTPSFPLEVAGPFLVLPLMT
jgi:hypothetical protein